MRVLVVDDSNLTRSVLKNYISKNYENVEIIKAKNGEEALSLYKSEKPRLVFMDMIMPKMDGLTVIKEIIKINPIAKIIAVSSEKQFETSSIEAGAKLFLKKPLASKKVYEAIDKVL